MTEEAGLPNEAKETVRIDRWLCAARIFKSRTLAQDACIAGHVKVNGKNARPSQAIKPGDHIQATAPRGDVVVDVVALADKRQSAAVAQTLYEDRTPPPEAKEPRLAERERGAGRPTKADRRRMERFRGGF